MERTLQFHIKVSKKGSNDMRNHKILILQPNFTTFNLDVVFVVPGVTGVAGGLLLPRQVAIYSLQISSFKRLHFKKNETNLLSSLSMACNATSSSGFLSTNLKLL
jgi:hypothetical protein